MRFLRVIIPLAPLLVATSQAGDVVCVPTDQTKQTTRTCYRLKVDHVCLTCKPVCCGGETCGKPREVRKLVKRLVKEQAVEKRCEPVCPCPAEPVLIPPASGSSTPPVPVPPK